MKKIDHLGWWRKLASPATYAEGSDADGIAPPRWLMLTVAAGWGLVFAANNAVRTDDAFIYFRVARNLARGVGPVLNPGDAHVPVTGLGWVHIVSLVQRLAGAHDLPVLVLWTTGCIVTLAAFVCMEIFAQRLGDAVLLLPYAVVTLRLLGSSVGLESSLFLFLSWAVVALVIRQGSPTVAAVAIGFGFLVRGDILLLAIPVGIYYLLTCREGDAGRPLTSPRVRPLLQPIMAGAGSLAISLLIWRAVSGSALPMTLGTKILQGAVGPWPTYGSGLLEYVGQAVNGWYPLLVLTVIGILRTPLASALLLSAALIHSLAYALLGVADYPWYSLWLQSSVRVVTMVGAITVVQIAGRKSAQHWKGHHDAPPLGGRVRPFWTAAAAIVMATLVVSPTSHTETYAAFPGVARTWAFRNYHLAADEICSPTSVAATGRRTLILAEEVGVLGYFCHEAEIRDINGLATPGVDEESLNRWDHWISKYEPDYLVARGTGQAFLEGFPRQRVIGRGERAISVYRRPD